jgi:hypothetical protein
MELFEDVMQSIPSIFPNAKIFSIFVDKQLAENTNFCRDNYLNLTWNYLINRYHTFLMKDCDGGPGMNGLYLIEGGSTISFTTSDGLLSNEIRALSASPEGDIWIGTPDGINILSNNEFISITGEQGLPYEKVLDIFISSGGEVLISSEWGAMRKEGDKWHYYAGRRLGPG